MVTKVLALGDSLTMGVNESGNGGTDDKGTGGYRFPLWDALTSNNYDINFVGTLNPANTNNATSPLTFDTDHLGLRRWTVDELLNGGGPASTAAVLNNPDQKLDTWLTQYTPDLVLLMAGTNDVILHNQATSGIVDELETTIRAIVDTGAKVLVASPPPINLNASGPLNGSLDAGEDNAIAALAAALPTRINTLKAELGDSVGFVDIFNSLNSTTDVGPDGLHLTDAAYNKVAQQWYNAMVPLLSPGAALGVRQAPINIEAEAFDTIAPSYQTESIPGTDATVLSLTHLRASQSAPNVSAAASTSLQQLTAGQYDVILRFFDERDGTGEYQVSIGDTVISTFTTSDAATLPTGATSDNYTHKTIATAVDINPSDRVTVTFTTDRGESRSFDSIQFVRVGGSVTPPPSTPVTTNPGTTPVTTTPSTTNPGTTNPGTTNPGTTSGTTTPGTTDPGTTIPGTTDPGTTSGTTDPGTTPGTTNPGTTPGTTDPGTTPGTTTNDNTVVDDLVIVGEVAEPLAAINFRGKKGSRIRGTNGKDKLPGTKNNDVIIGRNGNDNLIGKAGNDRTFAGKGNDRVVGGGGSDYLRGDQGKDNLIGGSGGDVLWGGNDNNPDTLRGGGGADTYLFKRIMNTPDTIVGFQSGVDVINIQSILSGSQYGSGSGFEKFTQFVQQVQAGSNTEFQVDTDGLGNFQTVAILQGTGAIASTDVVI